MNLVEACKLAKNIENLKYQVSSIISNRDYAVTVTERHLKSKAVPEIADETIEDEVDNAYDITIEDAIKLLDILMEKKAILSSAIEDAKHNISIDVNGSKLAYDSAVEYNKFLRNGAIYNINRLNRIKEGVSKSSDADYKLDVEGKQTRYVYPKEVEIKANFDLKETKKKEKAYRTLAEKISNDIDAAKLNTNIDVDVDIDVNDTLEDIIEKYLKAE